MNKRENRMTGTLFRLLFINALWLPIILLAIFFEVRRPEPSKPRHRAAPNQLLQFASRGHILGFSSGGVYIAGGSHALHVEFVSPRESTPVSDAARDEGALGREQRPTPLSQVAYPNLWDGITLTYDAPGNAIARSTYRLEPHANPGNICLRYNAPIAVQNDGSLRVSFKTGTLNETAPQAWQERDGKRMSVRVAFAPRENGELAFALGEYDPGQPLFIDPTVTWSTFLGGTDLDEAYGLAVDVTGNFYVAGFSYAPWGSPVQAWDGGYLDGFAAKLDPNGNLIWNTFFGGGNAAECYAVAVDLIGNVYVTGLSDATFGSPVNAFSPDIDIFAAKLDPNGNLIWNTFFGGSSNERETGRAVAVDAIGNVYLAGNSTATWGSPIRPFSGGDLDAFAAKLDPNGNLIWNTFLGGSGTDYGYALAVNTGGNVYVGGNSSVAWGSPIRPFSGSTAGYVAKLDPTGTLIWNTFLGGNMDANCSALALDASGNIYAAGFTRATWGTPVRAYTADYDGFAAKLDPSGALVWNTFLGGGGSDQGTAVSLDAAGNIYIGGSSGMTWGTPTNGFNGGADAFAAKLDPNGALTWNTFVGGDQSDFCFGVAVDASGNVGLSGWSNATWGSPIRSFSGGAYDAFVAKVPVTSPTPTPTPTPGCQITTSIASNFNGTAISSGNYIWFSSVLRPGGLVSTPVTIRFTQQTITSANFTLSVPDASVTFDPTANSATTTFSGGMWVTRVPSVGLAGNTFLSGLSYLVPANLPGGIRSVTWSGTVSIDTPGVSLNWQWAAAVYTTFSSNHNALGVKPVDDGHASQYQNADHAGTPENFKSFVTGGATGGGGMNYTGSLSATASVGPCPR